MTVEANPLALEELALDVGPEAVPMAAPAGRVDDALPGHEVEQRTAQRAQRHAHRPRAVQITFVLKGHLKNVQVAYIRVAALLARVRDEKLYRALGHATMDDYAAVRLGLQHAQLYRYLAVYDWIREFHRPWLARRPKGFIPELTDAQALMWIEHRLRDPHLSDGLRKELERLRAKALAGRLTLREFQEARQQGRRDTPPLRAVLRALGAARRRLAGIPG